MKYEKIKYPDGQISAKITHFYEPCYIEMSILSYEDLFYLRSLAEVLRYNDIQASARINCLFAQRSDIRFKEDESFDLKLIAEVINNCNFKTVHILDPHSSVSLALINNSVAISPLEFVKKTISALDWWRNCTLIAPDAGAYKKVYIFAENMSMPIVGAVKHRNREGEINLQIIGDVKDKNCLIVDDLLDGGFTFHVLGEKLKELGAAKVCLYITHAYFNKGTDFTKNIDHFYCTDSVKKIEAKNVTQFKL